MIHFFGKVVETKVNLKFMYVSSRFSIQIIKQHQDMSKTVKLRNMLIISILTSNKRYLSGFDFLAQTYSFWHLIDIVTRFVLPGKIYLQI